MKRLLRYRWPTDCRRPDSVGSPDCRLSRTSSILYLEYWRCVEKSGLVGQPVESLGEHTIKIPLD